jgi:hypothetical protein
VSFAEADHLTPVGTENYSLLAPTWTCRDDVPWVIAKVMAEQPRESDQTETSHPPPRQTGKPRPTTMPPMTLKGIVTKVGVMQKTATVTVSRWVIHKQTGKVCMTW